MYEDEIWKQIPIAPEYEASSYGRIRHIKNKIIRKTNLHYKGYPRLTINHARTEKVHRLVASAFVPNPQNLPQVNHIDGDKSNNYPWNLEWCDSFTNMKHAHLHNLKGNSGKKTDHRPLLAWNVNGDIIYFRTTRDCSRFFDIDNRSIKYHVQKCTILKGYRIAYADHTDILIFEDRDATIKRGI